MLIATYNSIVIANCQYTIKSYYYFMKKSLETIRVIFAKNTKKYRVILKYSQEKLAEKAGLSVQTIKDIEGCRRWISDNTLSSLARALNISEFQLFLPEKLEKDKKYRKPAVKSLMALKTKLELYLDEQFENTLNSGDFSGF